MKSIWVLIFILITSPCLHSQSYSSRNNYTGNWEDKDTWDSWSNPQNSVNGTNLTISGNISIHSSLTFSGNSSTLTITDTLVIFGDLNLGNNISLQVHTGGILIIRGNLTITNNTGIFTNGYVIITGDFRNESFIYDGSFWTTRSASQVFIAGAVPEINNVWYPVLDCSHPSLLPFTHSGCAYGNTTDLMEDPIYGFYTTTCNITGSAGSNSPLCMGQPLKLTASGGSSYLWSGPASFNSNIQNPIILNAGQEQEGDYVVRIMASGCIITDTLHVFIHENPVLTASVNSPVCEGEPAKFSASGANEYVWSGPGAFGSILTEPVISHADSSISGLYIVKGTSDGCSATDTVLLKVTPKPNVSASISSPVCEGASVSFTATGAADYTWTGPDNFFSHFANPIISNIDIAARGKYVLTGITSGCSATDTAFLVVNSLPLISASSNSPICTGDDIFLAGKGGSVYYWQGPSGFVSTVQDPVITNAVVSYSGAYNLLVATSEGCSDSTSIMIEVKDYPVADAGEDQVLENSYRTNMQAELSGVESGTWYPGTWL